MARDSRYWQAFERDYYDRAGIEAPIIWQQAKLPRGFTISLARLTDDELGRAIAVASGRRLRFLRMERIRRRRYGGFGNG